MLQNEPSSIIDSDKPLIGLKGHFGSGLEALRFFARSMEVKYSYNNISPLCCMCNRNPSTQKKSYHWQAGVGASFSFTKTDALLLLAGKVGMTMQQSMVNFTTVHGFCVSCGPQASFNRKLAVIVKGVSFFLMIVCMMLASIGAVILLDGDPKSRQEGLTLLAVNIFGLIASIAGHAWERKLNVPVPLRAIGRKPFYLMSVTGS